MVSPKLVYLVSHSRLLLASPEVYVRLALFNLIFVFPSYRFKGLEAITVSIGAQQRYEVS